MLPTLYVAYMWLVRVTSRHDDVLLTPLLLETISSMSFLTRFDALSRGVIELLEKIHQKHPGEESVLHLDNARYQHARKLKEWIAQQQNEGITSILAHVPPYSRNLNLIERL